jgi:hypothetical protein
MNTQPEALRLAEIMETTDQMYPNADLSSKEVAAELRRLHHNNEVLLNALWKACGDNKTVVNNTIKSQGKLK